MLRVSKQSNIILLYCSRYAFSTRYEMQILLETIWASICSTFWSYRRKFWGMVNVHPHFIQIPRSGTQLNVYKSVLVCPTTKTLRFKKRFKQRTNCIAFLDTLISGIRIPICALANECSLFELTLNRWASSDIKKCTIATTPKSL